MNQLSRHALFGLVALVGAFALGTVALHRGESINALWIVVAAVSVYLIAYRYYGLFIARTVMKLDVKSRLIVNALFEQFGFFLLPFLQRLNRRKMVERTLWNQLVVSFHIALKRCLQLSC